MPRTSHVRQLDQSDCAAACLASVASSYRRETSITQLRDALGTGVKGTTIRGLVNGAEALGFETSAVRVDKEALSSRFTLPAIAHMSFPGGVHHFVVIHRVRRTRVKVGDPAAERVRWVSYDEFIRNFSGVLVLLASGSEFVQKSGTRRSNLARFIGLLTPQVGLFVWAVLASLILTVLGISGSMVTKVLFDEVVPYSLESLLVPVFVLFAAVYIVQSLLQFVRQWIVLHLSQRIDLPLILGFFQHIYGLPLRFFASRPVGDILTRFGDAMTIKNVLTGAALTVVMDVVMAVIAGVVLFTLDQTLFFVVAVFVIVALALIMSFRIPFRNVNQKQMAQASVLNSRIIDGLKGVEGVKLEANEKREMEGLEREYVRSLRISFKEGMLDNAQSSIMGLAQAFVGLVLLVLGTSRILQGDMTIGTLMAFIALANFFVDPVTRLIGLQLSWQEAALALTRVGEILDYDPEPDSSDELRGSGATTGDVTFDEVSFGYSLREPTLRDLSFHIAPGSKVAFVGASGSGKSTIARMLLKVHHPDQGVISFGRISVADLDAKDIRRGIGYCPQNVQLYARSVLENVKMSSPDASDAEAYAALRKCGMADVVARLPQSAATVLDEGGMGLSGGERRRIALARVLMKRVDLYIFDEVTSDLDPASEVEVMQAIYDHVGESTAIFVAHRLATISGCDAIFVLDGGRIVESGTHDELLRLGSVYAEMWQLQNERVPDFRKRRHSMSRRRGPEVVTAPSMQYLD
ncbi:peptidase domain-containing ABC transporter [Microbacterium sp. SA39]|uniref:peptidase domain-containing ABC transporter n=1 Tax=Microbacterium sp. SA39 TaxID=1263625 RepID=UPI0005FA188A|nr:peptidase domain-containing ABC transporter [Microbacterium sp. SA39]KJQ55162.1 Lactococcin-G-processing and transport ATP-binding protein LagD [Microbacterium sp. SA39]